MVFTRDEDVAAQVCEIERRRSLVKRPTVCEKKAVPDVGLPLAPGDLQDRWLHSMRNAKVHLSLQRLLKRTVIFAETSDDFRSFVADHCFPVEYHPGQVVFQHDQPGNWMGILLNGRLEKHFQRQGLEISLGEVTPGGVVGDLGVFGVTPRRSFRVTATHHSTMLVLTQQVFEEAIEMGGTMFPVQEFLDGSTMQNLMQDTESFLQLRCFSGLDRAFVMKLREASEPRMGYPGQVLMKEHHFGDEMFILRAGSVKISKNNKFVVELPAGVVFGELAVLGSDKRRTATVTCSSLCLLRVLHADVFHDILSKFPAAKRVFDHAYIARMISVAVLNAKDEMQYLDHFYGSANPKTTAEMQDLFGATIRIEDSSPKKAKPTGLPPLGSPKKATGPRSSGLAVPGSPKKANPKRGPSLVPAQAEQSPR